MTIVMENRLTYGLCLGCGSNKHSLCRSLTTVKNTDSKYKIICPVTKVIGKGILDNENELEFYICPYKFTEHLKYDICELRLEIKNYEKYGSGRKVLGDLSGLIFSQEVERICELKKQEWIEKKQYLCNKLNE